MEVQRKRSAIPARTRRPRNSNKICFYYLHGRCNRNPCRFAHAEPPTRSVNLKTSKQLLEDRPRKIPNFKIPKNVGISNCSEDVIRQHRIIKIPNDKGPRNSLATSTTESADSGEKNSAQHQKTPEKVSTTECTDSGEKNSAQHQKTPEKVSTTESIDSGVKNSAQHQKTPEKICERWLHGNCVRGDDCQFMHSWFSGDGFTMLAKLDGHRKAVTGIALPLGSDKLYSCSSDGTVRLWDCNTGECASVINIGAEVGSLICEGPWIFIGMPDVVKAWNIESSNEFSLSGPIGQVYCMVVANEMLFAGAQDGIISAWKGTSGTINPFYLASSLKGHIRVVTCLAVGGKRLYSGSLDNTIRVWDLDTLQPVMTLDAHTDVPMSLLCWDQFLLSCSLDNTIKVWAATERGNLEVTYRHNEEHGLLALCGMNDADGKPILLCACNDNTVRLYELPSFIERGRIFSKHEVRALQIGPDGLFFTGDGTGMLSVWKLMAKPSEEAA